MCETDVFIQSKNISFIWSWKKWKIQTIDDAEYSIREWIITHILLRMFYP